MKPSWFQFVSVSSCGSAGAFAARCEQHTADIVVSRSLLPFPQLAPVFELKHIPETCQHIRADKGSSTGPDCRTTKQGQTTALFYGRNTLKQPCYDFSGSDDPLIMVVGPREQLPLIPEAVAKQFTR